jgi:hypothetical protein
MKKPKVVADLLTVTDVYIEASEARARILESCGKGPSKKKSNDLEINMTDRGDSGDHRDCRDRGYRGNRQRQPTDQKEKRHFCRLADAGKWCEIHHINRHDLKECKTFLDRKKMPPPASVSQEPHRGKHRRADHDNEDQMEEINIIFRGSMSITSKTQG